MAPALPRPGRRAAGWRNSALFLLACLLIALALRCAVVMPRSIPSESMMPGLAVGDYLLVAKWPYGWSRFSLPVAPRGPHGRLFGRAPARGDVVVFRAPPADRVDYIKRVIGLPGETVALRGGVPWIDGVAAVRARIADFVLPMAANTACRTIAVPPYGVTRDAAGARVCRLPRYRETLPGGASFEVIDQGWSPSDDFGPVRVPTGRYFLLGDNRDLSEDSRFAPEDGGIGMVPAENLEGRALVTVFSTGGGFAIRPERMARAIR